LAKSLRLRIDEGDSGTGEDVVGGGTVNDIALQGVIVGGDEDRHWTVNGVGDYTLAVG